jgi:hypothetical protein
VSDLVVTVPKGFWPDWIDEGDAAGEPADDVEWGFFLGGARPRIEPGEHLYIVAWGLLRGYAPVTSVERTDRGWAICRRGGAVAVTIQEPVPGFRGWRARWWPREAERPFPDWQTAGLPEKERRLAERLAARRAESRREMAEAMAAFRARQAGSSAAAQREQG